LEKQRVYFAIDLKSFYASVECVERGLDPLTTNLLVADSSRTEKTICLAVSPSLKAYGIWGRARLFEAVRQVERVNEERRRLAPDRKLVGSSWDDLKIKENGSLKVDYITAPPRMALYSKYSNRVYGVYLRYFAPEDIHDYSIDEVFIDATDYLKVRKSTPHELVREVIKEVLRETGITATAGIGTNMYLCKVAMDIVAKHVDADEDGVRIAELNELSYREQLWDHKPLTDFWRVGRGIAAKLEKNGMFTMGDVARCSLGTPSEYRNEELLYKLFGINAELLIDHAWGIEPCLMSDVKSYRPSTNSVGTSQVLHCPYTADAARLIVNEMIDLLALDLVDRAVVTDQIVLTIGYDRENLTNPEIRARYKGEVVYDHYGRLIPKHSHGTENLGKYTSSSRIITEAMMRLYDRIINKDLLVRRVTVCAARLLTESDAKKKNEFVQLDFFTDYEEIKREKREEDREKSMQKAVIDIKKKFGKNAILKGMNLSEGATARERNNQIGGHKA